MTIDDEYIPHRFYKKFVFINFLKIITYLLLDCCLPQDFLLIQMMTKLTGLQCCQICEYLQNFRNKHDRNMILVSLSMFQSMGIRMEAILKPSDQQGCHIWYYMVARFPFQTLTCPLIDIEHDFDTCDNILRHGELNGNHVETISSSVDTQTSHPAVIPRVTERRSGMI